jgi:serine phosphatase RsbU (regulator of sigma subunit)
VSRILIVEDDPAVLRGLRDNLSFESYDVLTASDAERAYKLIHDERPDLVLMDVMLPGMLGSELCRRVRAEGVTTPIVMLSAKSEESDRVLGLDLGADDYIGKPFGVQELSARIRSILRNRREALGDHDRLGDELRSAADVQRSLFPSTRPSLRTLDCAGVCRPASAVGGDYFDYVPLSGDRLGLVIADVSGKGTPASLMMASVHAWLRALAGSEPAARVLERLNRFVYSSTETSRYVTLFYGELDPRARRLVYVNAGHVPPFLVRAAGGEERLRSGGPVLGLLEEVTLEPGEVELGTGDLLAAVTDGVTEATSPADQEFGDERVRQALAAQNGAGAQATLAGLIAAVDGWAGPAGCSDDLTALILRAT